MGWNIGEGASTCSIQGVTTKLNESNQVRLDKKKGKYSETDINLHKGGTQCPKVKLETLAQLRGCREKWKIH